MGESGFFNLIFPGAGLALGWEIRRFSYYLVPGISYFVYVFQPNIIWHIWFIANTLIFALFCWFVLSSVHLLGTCGGRSPSRRTGSRGTSPRFACATRSRRRREGSSSVKSSFARAFVLAAVCSFDHMFVRSSVGSSVGSCVGSSAGSSVGLKLLLLWSSSCSSVVG